MAGGLLIAAIIGSNVYEYRNRWGKGNYAKDENYRGTRFKIPLTPYKNP